MYFTKLYKKRVFNGILTSELLIKKLVHYISIIRIFKENYLIANPKNFKAYRQALQVRLKFLKINYNSLLLLLPKFVFKKDVLELLFGCNKKVRYLLIYTLELVALKKKKGVLFLARNTKGLLIKCFIVKGAVNKRQSQPLILLALSKMVLTLPLLVKNTAVTLHLRYFTYNASKFILKFFERVFVIRALIQRSMRPYNGCRPKKERRKKLK